MTNIPVEIYIHPEFCFVINSVSLVASQDTHHSRAPCIYMRATTNTDHIRAMRAVDPALSTGTNL